MATPEYVMNLDDVHALGTHDRDALQKVEERYAFRSNDYYLSLIDWDDPDDPIRKIVVPDPRELEEWGDLDPSVESDYSVVPGLQHKYDQTGLLLISDMCAGFCRYCFRKRLFMDSAREVLKDISTELEYIRTHPEITNVLLTGGDPLILSTEKLGGIIREIREIDHVHIIRIGSKVPAYNPYRIIQDPSLMEMVRKYSTPDKRIYLMTQFNHPRELTDAAVQGLDLLREAGAVPTNQTPLLRGVNDDPAILAELFKKLSFIGVPPYYVFQCRPALGNQHFTIPLEESYRIYEDAKRQCSGLAKRSHFVMSHKTGKIAIVGLDDAHIYFKYHQAAQENDIGKFIVCNRNPEAYWYDDYEGALRECMLSSLN